MLSWRRLTEGGAPGSDAHAESWEQGLRHLALYIEEGTGYLRLLHRRDATGWNMRSFRLPSSPGMPSPPEAKTMPVDAPSIAAGTFAALEREAREKWRLLARCPTDGKARLELIVDFDDE